MPPNSMGMRLAGRLLGVSWLELVADRWLSLVPSMHLWLATNW